MYKACIFDLDGTLTDSEEGILKISAEASLGMEPDVLWSVHFVRPETQSLRGLKKVWKFTAESLEKIVCTMYVLMMALFRC